MRALVAGGTGLVGGHLISELLLRGVAVHALGRRKPPHPGIGFGPLEGPAPTASLAFCALGTTIKKAGSREAFRAVDFDAVLAFARLAKESGARGFGLVSSSGGNSSSPFFYLRVKGQAEEAVSALDFPALVISKPGLLLGQRAESRPAERLAQAAAPFLSFLLPPAYRPVEARAVAAALVEETMRKSGLTP
jgi:uncharacterized protein YbjT (DUF2867 family)